MLRSICAILKIARRSAIYHRLKFILPPTYRQRIAARCEDCSFEKLASTDKLLSKLKVASKLITARIGAENFGDYLEFGVYRGASLSCAFQAMKEMQLNHVRLFGFDSFEGYPISAAVDNENLHHPGDHKCPIEATLQYLASKAVDMDRTHLIKGWFADTLTNDVMSAYAIKKASIIMIDCGLYSAAKIALDFCLPLMRELSIVFISNWNKDRVTGERKAFEKFLFENPSIKAKLIDTYQHNQTSVGRFYLIIP